MIIVKDLSFSLQMWVSTFFLAKARAGQMCSTHAREQNVWISIGLPRRPTPCDAARAAIVRQPTSLAEAPLVEEFLCALYARYYWVSYHLASLIQTLIWPKETVLEAREGETEVTTEAQWPFSAGGYGFLNGLLLRKMPALPIEYVGAMMGSFLWICN